MRSLFFRHIRPALVLAALTFLSALPAATQATNAQELLWDAAMQGDTAAMATALRQEAPPPLPALPSPRMTPTTPRGFRRHSSGLSRVGRADRQSGLPTPPERRAEDDSQDLGALV